jgi:hypothetical protein
MSNCSNCARLQLLGLKCIMGRMLGYRRTPCHQQLDVIGILDPDISREHDVVIYENDIRYLRP